MWKCPSGAGIWPSDCESASKPVDQGSLCLQNFVWKKESCTFSLQKRFFAFRVNLVFVVVVVVKRLQIDQLYPVGDRPTKFLLSNSSSPGASICLFLTFLKHFKRIKRVGWEPLSSGYGKRLMFRRSWVRILDWHEIFSHWFVVKIVTCLFQKTKNKRKRGRGWPI